MIRMSKKLYIGASVAALALLFLFGIPALFLLNSYEIPKSMGMGYSSINLLVAALIFISIAPLVITQIVFAFVAIYNKQSSIRVGHSAQAFPGAASKIVGSPSVEASACTVCHRYFSGVVKFADYQPSPQGNAGRLGGYAYFCREHLQSAQRLSHLPSQQAIPMLKQAQQQQSAGAGNPQGTVVFKQERGHLENLATVALFFTILPLCMIPMFFREVANDLSRGDFFSTAILLLMLSPAALFAHLCYWSFKQFRDKRPRLTLDSEGFVDLLVSEKRIFWRDITDMKFTQGMMRHAGLISKIKITLNENSEFKRNTFILKRMFNKISSLGYDVVVDVSRLDTPGSYAFDQFVEFYKRFGNLR